VHLLREERDLRDGLFVVSGVAGYATGTPDER